MACRACGERVRVHQLLGDPDLSQARPAPAVPLLRLRREGARACAPSARASISTFLGLGSEKVEEELHRAFPAARIARLDRDTVTGKRQYETILHGFPRRQLRHSGGHADDRQGPRHSQRDAGGRGLGRHGAGHAGFPRGRADLPAADAGGRARRTRQPAGHRADPDHQSRSLCRAHGRRAGLSGVL